ncbi:hypothetical protein [Paraburkholderia sp. NMBU_R16]|uniref:hypothetical protein n=1 Tax=Paraburkholderia sp. NMBU_R16 TaxID=2698676 RepID=UPI0020B863B6|nr:hypothetical protein [Paraburkholderia sp. NMBU_R16]
MKRTGKRHIVLSAIGALGVVLALAYAFWPAPMLVDTAPVSRGPLRVTIDEDGEIRAHDRYVVTAPVAGGCCAWGCAKATRWAPGRSSRYSYHYR